MTPERAAVEAARSLARRHARMAQMWCECALCVALADYDAAPPSVPGKRPDRSGVGVTTGPASTHEETMHIVIPDPPPVPASHEFKPRVILYRRRVELDNECGVCGRSPAEHQTAPPPVPRTEPLVLTPESLDAFLAAAIAEFDSEREARELAERVPAIKVAVEKLRMAQKISRALLNRRIDV